MKRKYKILAGIVLLGGLMTGCMAGGKGEVWEKPVSVTIWTYYNGPQNEQFNDLVQQFNDSVGRERNIIVEAVSTGSLGELIRMVTDSVSGRLGSEELPQLCAAYADTAFNLEQNGGVLEDMTPYLTESEMELYVDAYLDEGRLTGDGTLKVFPTAKSTEIMTINLTAWEPFAKESGLDLSVLSTWEGLSETAEKYYRWTDAKTPDIPNDGAAFFGRDAFANYILVGSSQLGHDIFRQENGQTVIDFDRTTMKKLWDFYYLPFVQGYYDREGKFASDDLKTGRIISYVGSTSGALYTPNEVIYEDGSRVEIACGVLPVPNFKGTEPAAIQQGAGMVMFRSDEKTERACMEFLKWFTAPEANLKFCLGSGYLPVMKEANDPEYLKKESGESVMPENPTLADTISTAMEEVRHYRLYTTKPFMDSNRMRDLLNVTMSDCAQRDREQVKKMIDSGLSLEEAMEALDSDGRFTEWYEDTYQKLQVVSE